MGLVAVGTGTGGEACCHLVGPAPLAPALTRRIGEGLESFEQPAIRGGEEAGNGIEMFPSMTRDS